MVIRRPKKLELDTVLYPAALRNSWDSSGDATNGKNNGPYEDGSYIYHGDLAYIGSCGGDALTNMAKVANGAVAGTGYAIDNAKFGGFLDWTAGGIVPKLWGGKMMSIVNGRTIMPELAKLVSATGTYTGMMSYGAEDKVVQHINDYTVALGLSSSRIAAYEWSTFENLKGWFQGDGTVWLYNDDWGQFAQNYLTTVDPYHLPVRY
jgi:hypothetical protein